MPAVARLFGVNPLTVRTERLLLVAATPAGERAAHSGRAALGWTLWQWLLRDDEQASADPLLVGYGGFKGRPASGECEVGYSVIESHHRRGLATEGTRALVEWAFESPPMSRIASPR